MIKFNKYKLIFNNNINRKGALSIATGCKASDLDCDCGMVTGLPKLIQAKSELSLKYGNN